MYFMDSPADLPGISAVSSWPCLYTKETPCRHTFCVTCKLASRRDSRLPCGRCAIPNLPAEDLGLSLKMLLAYSLARLSNVNRIFLCIGIISTLIETHR